MTSYEEVAQVAQQFTAFYYKTFDEDRASLRSLYRGDSMLTFENQSILGVDAIMEKLSVREPQVPFSISFECYAGTLKSYAFAVSYWPLLKQNLSFQKIVHGVVTTDVQPSNNAGGILVMVTGAIKADDEDRLLNYSQTFQLLPNGAGSYYVFNDLFKLILM
ncbi:MAG: Nuclear transport factor 2 [Trizodia sp. TS-e1964]|nr:MAG: Nuclear transport factor 2 [Trizodia sp. TS-e1964]